MCHVYRIFLVKFSFFKDLLDEARKYPLYHLLKQNTDVYIFTCVNEVAVRVNIAINVYVKKKQYWSVNLAHEYPGENITNHFPK